MSMVRLRVTGSETAAASLITILHGIEGVERVEEVADLMPHMDDEDSSSAGLPDDMGPGVHSIEVMTSDDEVARRVKNAVGDAADQVKASIEFVDEF